MKGLTVFLISVGLVWVSNLPTLEAHNNKVFEDVSLGFGIPRGLLVTLCERESGAREDKKQVLLPGLSHDGGKGAGACGMNLETAAMIVGRKVSRKELENLSFSAVVSSRYLTEPKWCGKWERWEARVFCYRVGHNHKATKGLKNRAWKELPEWWGTHKIFKRWSELYGEEK